MQRQQRLVGHNQGVVALCGGRRGNQCVGDHRQGLWRLLQPGAVLDVDIGVRLAGNTLGDRLHTAPVERTGFRRLRRIITDQWHLVIIGAAKGFHEIGEFLIVETVTVERLEHRLDRGFYELGVACPADLGAFEFLARKAPGALDRGAETPDAKT